MKKIKVLVLITVFAFATLGGAYAMWADQLVINETVKTGMLDVQFEGVQNPDPGPNYEGYPVDNLYVPYNVYGTDGTDGKEGLDEMDNGNPNNAKNIAYMDAWLSDQTECSDSGAYNNEKDVLNIELFNGYPHYQERIFTTIKNTGTIPAKFNINTENARTLADKLIVEIWFDAEPNGTKDGGEDFMIWSNQTGYIKGGKCFKPKLEGYQIDPGESIPVAIYTRVKQAAAQDKTYSFSIKLTAQQWNEYGIKGGLKDKIQTIDRKDPNYDAGNGVNKDEPKFSDYNKSN